MDLIMRYLIALLFCFSLAAQQTVNNFTVKTNLVSKNLVLTSNPISPNNSTNWFTISTWGDSLTQGSGASSAAYSYPSVFELQSGFNTINGGVPGETSTQIKTRFDAATSQRNNSTIIWAGRNNYFYPNTVLSDIASMVSSLNASGNSNYLILSVLNGYYLPQEASGGAGYNIITNLNATLASTYGSKYLDVRSFLVSLYNPANTNDVQCHNLDIPPLSLRSDDIHLNDAGYAAVANYIATNGFAALNNSKSPFISPKALQVTLATGPQIGTIEKATGYFSSISSTNIYGTNVYGSTSVTTPLMLIGTPAANKAIYLAGDNVSIQFASRAIPDTDASFDLGYSSTNLRWRDLFLSRNLVSGSTVSAPFAYLTNIYSTAITSGTVYVGTATTNKALSLSGDSSSIQSSARFIPDADASYDLGYSATQLRWRNGYFTGTVQSPTYVVGSSGGPTITSGTGVPSGSQPNGSLYLRTDGAGPNLYVRENGAWVSK